MLAYGVNYAILSSFRSTYFVHRKSIGGFNTLIFSPRVDSTEISPAHFFEWFLQALSPDTSNHIFNDLDMSCVQSWYEFYRNNITQNNSLQDLSGSLLK